MTCLRSGPMGQSSACSGSRRLPRRPSADCARQPDFAEPLGELATPHVPLRLMVRTLPYLLDVSRAFLREVLMNEKHRMHRR